MSRDRPKVVVIGGPTASGKTAIGMEIAERFRGEIVSADSVQIYRFMDVGSAKPSAEERSRVVHHMIDIRDPDEEFSAGEYVHEARRAIDDIIGRGRLPVVVGGTGLYIRGLLGGILELPPADPSLRRALREEEGSCAGTLYRKLCEADPETAARTPSENLVRIIRGLEVFVLTGQRLSELQRGHAFSDRPYESLFLFIDIERSILYERIDRRVDSMIEGGLVEEVTRLRARGYSRDLASMQSLGYRHVGMVLSGEANLHEAVGLMKRDTRHYAKRQFTWFRSEPEAVRIDPSDDEGVGVLITDFLGR